MIELKIYRMNEKVGLPNFATRQSACFDLQCFFHKKTVVAYSPENIKEEISVFDGKIVLPPGYRALIPTGMVMDIPEGHSVRLHPRSGTSLKFGLTLINSEGIIDSDYTEEVMIPLFNASSVSVVVSHGERYAQAEMVELARNLVFSETIDTISQKTDRVGGFGSTGVS